MEAVVQGASISEWIRRYTVLDTWASEIQEEKQALRAKIQGYLEDRDLKAVRGEQGSGASLSEQERARVSYAHEDAERVEAWLRETGHEDVVKRTIHPSTLAKVVETLQERGETIPEFLKVFWQPQLTIRKGSIAVPALEVSR